MTKSENPQKESKPICGIIMPISSIDGCNAEHWNEVKGILTDSISDAGYEANLVSDSDDSGVIQKRIVQNLYNNEIVVCDVSCKNPNVMFELGMRLAFDKPTIVVMDDMTKYSFDTAPIEHLSYPRDLSYYKIMDFKKKLCEKIQGTISAAKSPKYTTFLKHFGEFKVAEIEDKEGSINDVILSKLNEILNLQNRQSSQLTYKKEQEFSDEIIDKRIQVKIDEYLKEHNMQMSELFEKPETGSERKDLFQYLESDPELRRLCRYPDKLKRCMNRNIFPF